MNIKSSVLIESTIFSENVALGSVGALGVFLHSSVSGAVTVRLAITRR